MARHTVAHHTEMPAAIVTLMASPPACFSPQTWKIYVEEYWREHFAAHGERERLLKGGMPQICDACTLNYRASMLAAGRCHPPAGSVATLVIEGTST